MTVGTLMTAEELLQLPDDGMRHELVRGELRTMSPTGSDHGYATGEIAHSLGAYVKSRRLGVMVTGDMGFRISRQPDTVRAPDVAFIRADRVVRGRGFYEGPPDVAFEVISPNDRSSEVKEKTADWLSAGTRAVVLVDPQHETVRIHRPNEVI